jgi:predicted acylesterase/phospholipase RssA
MDPGGLDTLVFAGGGCRCAWQLGFWSTAAPALGLVPRQVATVSAGAAMACLVFADAVTQGLDAFKRRVAANPRNAYPLNALRGRPVFPHERIYRDTVLEALDEAALARLRTGPDVRVLLARPPAPLGPRAALLFGLVAYELEKLLTPSVHARVGRRAGFRAEVVSVRDCATPADVADLILHSSCAPPVTPAYRRGGRLVLDGGLVDHVPIEAAAPPAGRTLVLLTRRYPPELLPKIPGRTYVQPSEPVPIAKWDYTSPEKTQQTYDLGRRDGDAFVQRGLVPEPTPATSPGRQSPPVPSPVRPGPSPAGS